MRRLLTVLYRVDVRGLDNYHRSGPRQLIVANHTSYLDAVLLTVFLPEIPIFVVNTQIAAKWWLRIVLRFFDHYRLDPTRPLSVKSLINLLKQDRHVMIFPEGRITVTGELMKIYQGPGLVADRSCAAVLPVRIDGPQYTPFSRLRGRVRLRWFPPVTMTILPPSCLAVDRALRGRARRQQAAKVLSDLMTEMVFETTDYDMTVFDALLEACEVHGRRHVVAEDIDYKPVNYSGLVTRAFVLGDLLAPHTAAGERVGLLLPSMVSTLVTFFALHSHGRVPAVLNYATGHGAMAAAAKAAGLRLILTSRRFIEAAHLEEALPGLGERARILYLEDLRGELTWRHKLRGTLRGRLPRTAYRRLCPQRPPQGEAVILFTSGTESLPKGVVLSHRNLLANQGQIAVRMDFHAQDLVLNALPLFHSFGLTAGTLLPLMLGIKVFLYPTPLHYRIIPEVVYEIGATIFFGTNTFLAGYARFAHPYDFFSTRYVFAGAEKLQEETRRVWWEKFGIRILEGYGATETSPVLAVNTPMDYRAGSVGRLLPGIDAYLVPIDGIPRGGRLCVRGPNVMNGYLLADGPGVLQPPATARGPGWYDTGDVVDIDGDGFVWVQGRARRFAKIGGEMISLAMVEDLVHRVWPRHHHAVMAFEDPRRGEYLLLLTEKRDAVRPELVLQARAMGLKELVVPRRLVHVSSLPLLGSGKVDYPAARRLAEEAAVLDDAEADPGGGAAEPGAEEAT